MGFLSTTEQISLFLFEICWEIIELCEKFKFHMFLSSSPCLLLITKEYKELFHVIKFAWNLFLSFTFMKVYGVTQYISLLLIQLVFAAFFKKSSYSLLTVVGISGKPFLSTFNEWAVPFRFLHKSGTGCIFLLGIGFFRPRQKPLLRRW